MNNINLSLSLSLPLPPSLSLQHSMSRLQHDFDELKEKCERLEVQMMTKMSEVDHLKRSNQQARDDIAHFRKVPENNTIPATAPLNDLIDDSSKFIMAVLFCLRELFSQCCPK